MSNIIITQNKVLRSDEASELDLGRASFQFKNTPLNVELSKDAVYSIPPKIKLVIASPHTLIIKFGAFSFNVAKNPEDFKKELSGFANPFAVVVNAITKISHFSSRFSINNYKLTSSFNNEYPHISFDEFSLALYDMDRGLNYTKETIEKAFDDGFDVQKYNRYVSKFYRGLFPENVEPNDEIEKKLARIAIILETSDHRLSVLEKQYNYGFSQITPSKVKLEILSQQESMLSHLDTLHSSVVSKLTNLTFLQRTLNDMSQFNDLVADNYDYIVNLPEVKEFFKNSEDQSNVEHMRNGLKKPRAKAMATAKPEVKPKRVKKTEPVVVATAAKKAEGSVAVKTTAKKKTPAQKTVVSEKKAN